MSRRTQRPDKKSDKPERGRPQRRQQLPPPEVVLARRRTVSVSPTAGSGELAGAIAKPAAAVDVTMAAPAKRVARIVTRAAALDDAELERRHLLSRLLDSEGPRAVTRAALCTMSGLRVAPIPMWCGKSTEPFTSPSP